MAYIDGFVIPVPRDRKQDYIDLATQMAPIFKQHGALRVVECWGDDVPDGKVTDFRRSVQAGTDEIVCFAFIEWPSREVRDAANKKIMEDPSLQPEDVPFDGKRMIFGGFAPILDI